MRLLFGLIIFLSSLNSWADRNLTDIKMDNIENHFVFDFNFGEEINTDQINIEFDKNGAFFVVPKSNMRSDKNLVRVGQAGVKSILATPTSDGTVRAKIFFQDNINPQSYANSIQLQKTNTGVRAILKSIDTAWSNKVLGLPEVLPQGLEPAIATVLIEETTKENTVPLAPEPTVTEKSNILAAKTQTTDANTETKTTDIKSTDIKLNENVLLVNKKESEIPVLTKADAKKSSAGNTGFRLFMSFALIIATAIGLMTFAKWYQKRTQKDGDNNQIRILTQHYLGPKKSLAIVRVAGETILIGVTEQNISMIKSLSLIDDEFPEMTSLETSSNAAKLSTKAFASELNVQDKLSINNVKVTSAPGIAGVDFESTEEFVLSSIKNKISNKLKNLRPLG